MLFAKWEDWDMLDGSYFCFISLSTIGFGDIVPGGSVYSESIELAFIFCSMYLMLGMALIAMCFNLMQVGNVEAPLKCGFQVEVEFSAWRPTMKDPNPQLVPHHVPNASSSAGCLCAVCHSSGRAAPGSVAPPPPACQRAPSAGEGDTCKLVAVRGGRGARALTSGRSHPRPAPPPPPPQPDELEAARRGEGGYER